MSDNEILKTIIEALEDEEREDVFSDLETASYKHCWNNGLKRAVIIVKAELGGDT